MNTPRQGYLFDEIAAPGPSYGGLDTRLEDDQRRWEKEKKEMDQDPYYWEWLDQVERQLDRDLGEDNDR